MNWIAVIGVVVAILVPLMGFLANWIHKVADRVNAVDKNYAELAKHIAEQYVRSPEMQRMEHAVESLSNRLDTVAGEMRVGLANVAEKLNQLIGQASARKE